ncbi:unnamed protein product [Rotaria magnacalcarata]|uniref:Uncharacterized protein n=3 Tax=Rotaria magnacalcarata TaxID=392030 RepID=A0A819U4D1_9BILA|nr:unnamed protein product [Rotaria magnacalcarata]CAF2196602.1 unnamed protein product [Rotaria magnacalcarata]CAF3851148.1 unnamed protein product [Rotaria magnacalcarata]CAF4097225.1 unnamed protein product [Rotaria magnacalcarata]
MHHQSDSADETSRLRQFSWEQWDNVLIAVIYRSGPDGLNRYLLKRYVEEALFQSERWKQLSFYFSSISPIVRAYPLTSNEVELMRRILEHHLNDKLRLRITQKNDQLIEYEDLLEFISRIENIYNKNSSFYNHSHLINGTLSSIPSIPIIHSACTTIPTPVVAPVIQTSAIATTNHDQSLRSFIDSSTVKTKSNTFFSSQLCPISFNNARIAGSGWIQMNNVFLPFIIKNHQRLVPYEILVSCKVLQPNQLRATLIQATSADIALINLMIRDCKINNQLVPESALLINVYHILINTKDLVYVKILPINNPTSMVNHEFKNILSLHGGSFYIKTHMIPFVCSSQHSYAPLNDIFSIYPNLHPKLRHLARVSQTNELEYLQLVQMYYNKEQILPLDTLLIDMNDLYRTEITLSKTISLIEYHTKEKVNFDRRLALKDNLLQNKRKNPESHENRRTQQKLKTSIRLNRSTFTPSQSLAGYFPIQSTPLFHSQQYGLSSHNEYAMRAPLQ